MLLIRRSGHVYSDASTELVSGVESLVSSVVHLTTPTMVLCDQCTQGGILAGEPKGSIQPNGAYFASGPAEQTGKKKAIILLTDVFGLPLNNPKILADEFAEQVECDVWVPDIFAGESRWPY